MSTSRSWFGGAGAGITQQFSSLTGQISSFTKEVLTEATQEVEDPVTELQIAVKRVNELQTQNAELSSKLEQVKKRRDEETERADTAEFQVSTISQEYRKLLQQKEDDLKKLRAQNVDLREQQKHLVVTSSATPTATTSADVPQFMPHSQTVDYLDSGGGGGEWMDSWADEDYALAGPQSQSDISQLQSDLARLRVECQHWKELAQRRSQSPFVLVPEEQSSNEETNQDQLKELQLSLQQESDQHHHELTSLQTIHTQQLHTLALQYQQEIASLKLQLEQHSVGTTSEHTEKQQLEERDVKNEDVIKLVQQRCEELHNKNDELTAQVTTLVEQNHTLEQRNTSLMTSLQQSQLLVNELQQVIASAKEHVRESKNMQLQHLETDKKNLSSALQELQSSITGHQETIGKLTAEQEQREEAAQLLEAQVESLKQDLSAKQKEIESLRAAAAVTTLPQDAEQAVVETSVHSASEPAGLAQDSRDVELLRSELETERAERQRLQAHLAQMMAESDQELRGLLSQKEQLETELGSMREELDSSTLSASQENENLKSAKQELENKVHKLQETLSKTEGRENDQQTIHDLTKENESLSKGLSELKSALQQKQDEIVDLQAATKVRMDSVAKTNQEQIESMELRMKEKEQALQTSLRESQSELEAQQERTGQLTITLQSLQSELSVLRDKIAEMKEEKTQILAELEQTRTAHTAEKGQLMDKLFKMEGQAESADKCAYLLQQLQDKEKALDSLSAENKGMLSELEKTQLALATTRQEVAEKEEAKESKQERELQRLRQHLLQVEEQHTHEALEADNRESHMRQQIQQLEEKIALTSVKEAEQSLHVQHKVAMLEDKVQSLTVERDKTMHELSRVQDEFDQNATALGTLQAVLEQFQRDQGMEVNLALQRTEEELGRALEECQRLRELQESTQVQLHETSIVADQASVFQEEAEKKGKLIQDLSEEVKRYQATLSRNKLKIEELSGEGSQVDRYLIKNIIMTYFIASDKKKPDIIQLLARILHFTDQEVDQVMATQRGWIASLWKRPDTTAPSNKSTLASMFVQFLETESAPVQAASPSLDPSSSHAPSQMTTPTTATKQSPTVD